MFDKYCEAIKKLNNFDKTNILNKTFELYKDKKLAIYYAPHNEIINPQAKIFIVGITPGWTQTKIAYETAHNGLLKELDHENVKRTCKINSRFAGSMRKNLIEMLDELNLNQKLNITSCKDLFEENNVLLHTTSIIPYPVFVNNKNYTGSTPKIMESEILNFYVKNYFYKEIEELPNVFIIPLGKAVEEILEQMINDNIIKEEQCLLGFPHPSGANGHRKKQFAENKTKLQTKINKYFR